MTVFTKAKTAKPKNKLDRVEMNQSTVNLIIRADTSGFSESIRQAEQEYSSRFKKMGDTSNAQSNRIKEDFNRRLKGHPH